MINARKYQPALVFYEDIDQEATGARDGRLNQILNEMDGVLSKNNEVIVVMSSNNVQRVERGMLRPGRLDLVTEIGKWDGPAILKHLRHAIRPDLGMRLADDIEQHLPAIAAAAQDYPPAFIVEGVTKSKLYAISRNGHQDVLTVNGEDVRLALLELRPQYELMQSRQEVVRHGVDGALQEMVETTVDQVLRNRDLELVYDKAVYLEETLDRTEEKVDNLLSAAKKNGR